MKIKQLIQNLILIFLFSSFSFGQVPKMEPQIYSYQDTQNSKYLGKNISKLWIVRGALSNGKWNESPEYYEFDLEGRVILKVSEKFKNGEVILDTVIFTYAENGLWETKFELGEMTTRDFEFDKKNRLEKIISSNGETTLLEYNGQDQVTRIMYSEGNWKEFSYLENGQLNTSLTFQDSKLYQIDSYEYEKSVIHYTRKNMYDFSPNDTVVEYTSYFYNQDTLMVKIMFKAEDSSGWVTAITSMRYQNEKLITVTDCLTNNSSCSYVDHTYDENGHTISAIAYSEDGALKTRSAIFKYEFW